jgi:hypothetical protein
MASFEPGWPADSRLPTRRPTARGIMRGSRIQAKPGDYREAMTVPSIHRDPFSGAAAAVSPKLLRTHRRAHQTGPRQRVRNRAGAIVGIVVKSFVTAAVAIRLRAQLIGRPDGAFHRHRRVFRRQGQVAVEPRLVARGGGTGRRKRTRRDEPGRRRGQNRGANQEFLKGNSHKIFIEPLLCQRLCLKNGGNRQAQISVKASRSGGLQPPFY